MIGFKSAVKISLSVAGFFGSLAYASPFYIYSSIGDNFNEDINGNGQIVSNQGIGGLPVSLFHSSIWHNSSYTNNNIPGGVGTFATGINNKGQVVGYYADSIGGNIDGSFLKSDENWIYPLSGLPNIRATGINDSEAIVGYFSNGVSDSGFILSGNLITTFDVPHASGDTSPQDINNLGQVVGFYGDFINAGQTTNTYTHHGFIKSGSIYTELNVPNALQTFAYGINDFGDVVGDFQTNDGSTLGFLFSKGTYSVLDYPNLPVNHSTHARGINNNLDIVGFYTEYEYRGFIATPVSVPLPSVLWLYGSTICFLLARKKRTR